MVSHQTSNNRIYLFASYPNDLVLNKGLFFGIIGNKLAKVKVAVKTDSVSVSVRVGDFIKDIVNKMGVEADTEVNMDRDTIMSGAFSEVLSDLLSQGKITKQNVSNILFEYMDAGILTKSDVAKISSELKII